MSRDPRTAGQQSEHPLGSGRTGSRRPFRYRVLKGWAQIAIAVIYERVDVVDPTGPRPEGPAILAVNHTNALGDPVVVLAKTSGFPRFLAAESWWRFAPARWLFRLAGVLPVHRRRDPGDPSRNRSSFAACHDALARGVQIAIHPEGEMHQGPVLLPLRTGAARIALGAVVEAGVRDVTVIPHAVVYEDRGRWRSQAAVNVGAPIKVDDWADGYRADPEPAVRSLTEQIAEGMRAVAGAHETVHGADVVDRAAAYVLADSRDVADRSFGRRNELARRIGASIDTRGGESSPEFHELDAAVAAHAEDLRRLGVHGDDPGPRFVAEPRAARRRNAMGLAVLTPFAAVGLIANAPVVIGAGGAGRLVPGAGWEATTKGVVGSALCPLTWGIEAGLMARAKGPRLAAAIAVAGPLGGWAWLAWNARWRRWRHELWRDRVARTSGVAFMAAQASRAEVRRLVERVLAERGYQPARSGIPLAPTSSGTTPSTWWTAKSPSSKPMIEPAM